MAQAGIEVQRIQPGIFNIISCVNCNSPFCDTERLYEFQKFSKPFRMAGLCFWPALLHSFLWFKNQVFEFPLFKKEQNRNLQPPLTLFIYHFCLSNAKPPKADLRNSSVNLKLKGSKQQPAKYQ